MIVYCLENKTKNKKYIGCTKNTIEWRFKKHSQNRKSPVYLDIKQGDTFVYHALYECEDLQDAYLKEKYFIDLYNTLTPNGYNLIHGGVDGWKGFKRTIENKEKCAASKRGKKRPDHVVEILNKYNEQRKEKARARNEVDALTLNKYREASPVNHKRSNEEKIMFIEDTDSGFIYIGAKSFCKLNNTSDYTLTRHLAGVVSDIFGRKYRCVKFQ